MQWKARVLGGTIAACAFGVPVLATLRAEVPAVHQASINERNYVDRGFPIELRGHYAVELGGTFFVRQVDLHTRHPERLLAHQQIALAFGNYNTDPVLHDAELSFGGTGCVYRSRLGAVFRNDAYLAFARRPGCTPESTASATGDIRVRLRFVSSGRAAIWTFVRQPSAIADDALLVSTFGLPTRELAYVARGTVTDVVPRQYERRLALLAYVWEFTRGVWIVAMFGAAAVCMGFGVALLWPGRQNPKWCAPSGAFLAALACAGAYAIIVPPFQAADEPNHFVGLGRILERPALAQEAETLARRGEFEEIQNDRDRRFSPLDRGRPGIPWNDGVPPEDLRGTGARAYWTLAAPFVRALPVSRLLLAVRALHALLFAAAAAAFIVLVRDVAGATHPELVAAPLLLVPALPYFGMFMSNYAPLVSAYILFAAAVAITLWNGPRSYVAGPLAFGALACAVAISRSAVPMLPLAVSLAGARVLVGDCNRRRWAAAAFWSGAVLGAAALVVILADGVHARGTWLLAILAAAGTGATAELTTQGWRRAADGSAHTSTVVRIVGLTAAAIVVLLLSASLAIDYPVLLPLNPGAAPPARDYVVQALLAAGTFMRFGAPDPLTSSSFWVGFGWLEAMPPAPIVRLVAAASGLSLAALLAWAGLTRSWRTLAVTACVTAGFLGSITAYALSIVRLAVADLHGRYLIGLYLGFLVVAWSGAARTADAGEGRSRNWIRPVVGIGCVGVQTYCLCYLLQRYF